MKPRKPPAGLKSNPLYLLAFAFGVFLCVVSILIALIISVDRADELFNSVRYQGNWHQKGSIFENKWEPFKGRNYLSCILSIPKNLYVGLFNFPSSFMIGLIFFPLMIFLAPVYEGFFLGEAQMLLLAWLPFLIGMALLSAAGMMAEMDRVKRKILDKENQPKA